MIEVNENFEFLLKKFSIEDFDKSNIVHLERLSNSSIDEIVLNNGVLPDVPPFEKHPYIENLLVVSKITGLMVGTFPPISYLCSQNKIQVLRFKGQEFYRPCMDYFHGNVGSLWRYSPISLDIILNHARSQQPNLLKHELFKKGIVYTDIIKFCQRNLNEKNKYDSRDVNLNAIVFNEEIVDYIFNSVNINRIYFTNAIFYNQSNKLLKSNGKLNLNLRDSFTLFIKCLNDNKIKIEIATMNEPNFWYCINEGDLKKEQIKNINQIMNNKIVLYLKLTRYGIQRLLQICSSVSPAAVNRGAHKNICIEEFGQINNLNGVQAANEFLRTILNRFFENNLTDLIVYNK